MHSGFRLGQTGAFAACHATAEFFDGFRGKPVDLDDGYYDILGPTVSQLPIQVCFPDGMWRAIGQRGNETSGSKTDGGHRSGKRTTRVSIEI